MISIILPVFNAEKYLLNCLRSISLQTYKNFEAILVDDGSTDSSGSICDEFALQDNRFKVFHIENGGVAAARNYALGQCSGEYLMFVDSDDWVESDFLEKMYDEAVKMHSDMVICDFYIEKDHETKTKSHISISGFRGYVSEAILKEQIHPGLWHKLFLKQIIDEHNIRFPKYNYMEDLYFVLCYLHYASNVSFVYQPLYHYRIHGESLANDPNPEKRYDMYVSFIHNVQELEDVTLWKEDKQQQLWYYEKINTQKIRLSFFLKDRKDLLRKAFAYYPESVEIIDKSSFIGKAIYWATIYGCYLPMWLLFLKIRLFNK